MAFEVLFRHHDGRRVDKWRHYFQIYDRHLERFRGLHVRVLEIGVDHGGSLQIWKEYFGVGASIVGLDIDPQCQAYAEDRIEIVTGNQADVALLKSLGEFDIVIDDGSHRIQDQQASFNVLWPRTKSVYLIEDCHDGYPVNSSVDASVYTYPWVVVLERPQRLIRGTPSRELRADEVAATEAFACP